MRSLADTAAAAAPSVADVHIAGLLVQVRPSELPVTLQRIASLEHCEVFQSDASGRVVVLAETPGARAMLATFDELRALPGVLNVALVYQHAEPIESLEQDLTP